MNFITRYPEKKVTAKREKLRLGINLRDAKRSRVIRTRVRPRGAGGGHGHSRDRLSEQTRGLMEHD